MNKPFRDFFHQKLISQFKEVKQWFLQKTKDQSALFYSSFDIRDSYFKIACVDANVFPAGFNNICEEDQKRTGHFIQSYLNNHHLGVKKILLLAEEHSRNLYYWDNIYVIKSLIEQGGKKVIVCVPGKNILKAQTIMTASGKKINISLLKKAKGDLIISNNDFSVKYDMPPLITCRPPVKMGWLSRKKHRFF